MTNQADHGWMTCRVVDTEAVTPSARRIVIERPVPDGRRADAGTHLDVRVNLPNGTTDVRSYSIVESDPTGRLLTLTVHRAPASRGGSAFMHSLEIGAEIEATRPLQDFPLAPGADGYVLLAGGIGITALIEAARVLKRLGAHYQLVYAGRTRDAMPYLDALLAEHGDRVSLHVSDEDSSLDVEVLVEDIAQRPGRHELLMCGPVRLMDAVRRAWARAELSAVDLRFETFGNSGWYRPQSFEVHLPEQGISAIVDENQTMLEALSAAGADLMWDCRKGECGLCVMAVTDVQGELDQRDVFLSERQSKQGDRVCTCVSRVAAPAGSCASVTLRTP